MVFSQNWRTSTSSSWANWENIQNGNKPGVYLQFSLLEEFPLLMEPGTLCSERMQWNHTPRLFKRIPTLPSLMVKPIIWDKWCDRACAFWEPTQEPDDFRPGIALVVCYLPFQDLPQDNLRDKKTISMSLVYVLKHWVLPSFMEAAYVVNCAWDTRIPGVWCRWPGSIKGLPSTRISVSGSINSTWW